MAWGRGKGLEKPPWGGGGVQVQIEQVLGSRRAQLRVEAMICGFGLCGASDDWVKGIGESLIYSTGRK